MFRALRKFQMTRWDASLFSTEMTYIIGYPSDVVFFSRRPFPNLYFGSLLGQLSRRESPAAPPVENRRCSIQSTSRPVVSM
ncbi:hypothetical protein EMIT0P294_110061 [Pseudomonas sp. IT-P294]|jgi:hypothetical protein